MSSLQYLVKKKPSAEGACAGKGVHFFILAQSATKRNYEIGVWE
jgi:hypothetical protein